MKKLLKEYTLIIAILVACITPAAAKNRLTRAVTDSIASTIQNITLQEVAGSYVKINDTTVKGQGKRGSAQV